ncbi:MAG: GTP cyclohydrolase MptA [Promethearchaeota archaeon]
MDFKRDVQNEESLFGQISIDKVGITNVMRNVNIEKNNVHYSINAKINAFISLPATQRGIHMSRTAESIEEVINTASYKPAKNVEEFCLRITDALFREHPYTNQTEVEMKGILFIRMKPNERDEIQRAYEIYSKVLGERSGTGDKDIKKSVYVGISAEGMTVCPCAQEMSREYAKEILKKRKDLGIPEDKIDAILDLIPIASHNQRAKGMIIIGNGNGKEELVNVLDLIDVIESSMSARINSVLKRPDEAELVRIGHLNPKFAEDVVRDMAFKLSGKKFSKIPDDCSIRLTIESYESIHHHDVWAEINTNFKELRKLKAQKTQ